MFRIYLGHCSSYQICPQEKLVSSWLLGVIWPSCTFRKATPTSSPVPPEWGGKASETESYISRGLSGSLVTETWLQDYRMHPPHTYLAVALSHPVVSDSLWPCGLQPARLLSLWGFSRHAYWSGLSCPSPGDLPNPGVKLASSAFQADSSPAELPGKSPCTSCHHVTKGFFMGFHGDSDSKESVCNAGDPSLVPGLGRSPWEGNGYPLQYSYLENLPVHHVQWAVKNYKAKQKQNTQCEEAEHASETDMVGMLGVIKAEISNNYD